MKLTWPLNATQYQLLLLSGLMLLLNASGTTLFNLLSLTRADVAQGQVWRLLTGNLVHFGWAHTLMNIAAFLLCGFALLGRLHPWRFALLFWWCGLVVGAGIYLFNPEYATYAGLSGVIHGLIIAGLWYTRAHPFWLRLIALFIVSGKIVQEHSAGYHANELQALLPVPVAVDAHLYGALAGILFILCDWIIGLTKRTD